ncbi:MAG: sugar phosphate isomerase/epimerase [Alphaproteobacteria bacterium]|nr:sugar phosphate isomerase/epimerase [Alphaproteobacteria bacterium]
MKIGMITDSLGQMSFDQVLETSAELGIQMLEFACGNWSSAPHVQLDRLLDSEPARREFLAKVKDHGIVISALNCSGNPLHPGNKGREHDEITRKTIKLASLMGVPRVVMMSGCPGGPGDANPNWITTSWPPECLSILKYQWDDVLIPYWRDLVAYANGLGIKRICLELHGHQNVYNVETMHRLRNAVGATVGANYDPSHLMWMGADPIAAIRGLGDAIYHVHAKDTRIDPVNAGLNSVLDTKDNDRLVDRSWSYVTLGYGHGEQWWRDFCAELKKHGYDDVLSIEHEDLLMSPLEGVRKSVRLLREVAVNQ